jgi:Transposase IS116/IS110/IS902 family
MHEAGPPPFRARHSREVATPEFQRRPNDDRSRVRRVPSADHLRRSRPGGGPRSIAAASGTPEAVRRWVGRLPGERVEVAVACTGWLFVCEALGEAGAVARLAWPSSSCPTPPVSDRGGARHDRRVRPAARPARATSARLRRHADCRELMRNCGSGPVTAISIVCELGDVSRLSARRKAVRCAGLTSALTAPTAARGQGKPTRQGTPQLRWAL